MKKLLVLGVVLGGMAAMTSCKKDYTCECTATGAGTSVSTSTTINGKKKDVKDACEKKSTTVAGITTSCKIK